jgi:RecA/RadA recombinase
MGKPFDISKFRKDITQSIDGLSIGFNDPTDWISTGNFALNYLISGDFNRGIPLGKVTVFAGESGAGKSYICSGNIVKNAQEQGIFVILVDSENALDEKWLHDARKRAAEKNISLDSMLVLEAIWQLDNKN